MRGEPHNPSVHTFVVRLFVFLFFFFNEATEAEYQTTVANFWVCDLVL